MSGKRCHFGRKGAVRVKGAPGPKPPTGPPEMTLGPPTRRPTGDRLGDRVRSPKIRAQHAISEAPTGEARVDAERVVEGERAPNSNTDILRQWEGSQDFFLRVADGRRSVESCWAAERGCAADQQHHGKPTRGMMMAESHQRVTSAPPL